MNAIFLRGSVPPPHEHPEKLLYDNIPMCEDMWTQLFYYFLQESNGRGELLYQGEPREFVVDESFTEKWTNMKTYTPDFEPDVIICRGGFPYYDEFISRFPNAKKVYYGAGRRYWPKTGFKDYDLFVVDSQNQYDDIKSKGKNVQMLLKPAATMFSPQDVKKEYDICFMANAVQRKIKRHDLFIGEVAFSNLSVLNIGNTSPELIQMAKTSGANITWGGWHVRKFLPEMISRCRVGVCCSGTIDSCPRVIPEYLACGLPVIATDAIHFWRERYITNETGNIVTDSSLGLGMERAVEQVKAGGFKHVRECYNKSLGMVVAAKRLKEQIDGL